MKGRKPQHIRKDYAELQNLYHSICGEVMPEGIVPRDAGKYARTPSQKRLLLSRYFTHITPYDRIEFISWQEVEATLGNASHEERLAAFVNWCQTVLQNYSHKLVSVKKRKPKWADGKQRPWTQLGQPRKPYKRKGSHNRRPYRKRGTIEA